MLENAAVAICVDIYCFFNVLGEHNRTVVTIISIVLQCTINNSELFRVGDIEMGKKKAGLLSNSVYSKKSNAKKNKKSNPFALPNKSDALKTVANPFEFRTNREKFDILGKICKHNKGVPGVARSKSMKRRQNTLGDEFTRKNKSNVLLDRRITGKSYGHQNAGKLPSQDEILDARFAMGKMEHLKSRKASLFELKDDVLTHGGQNVSDLKYFACEDSDEEELYEKETQGW